MLLGILTLITALAISGVAAWFSIAGLMAIFSAAAMPIAIMAGTLEVGKLLTASWLYRYWNETSLILKTYLSIAVFVLMVITSMGIFGYLSKAHLDQASESGDAFAIVERIDGQIGRQENKIATWLVNEKNEIIKYQKDNWQESKDQFARNKEQIGNFFYKVTSFLNSKTN